MVPNHICLHSRLLSGIEFHFVRESVQASSKRVASENIYRLYCATSPSIVFDGGGGGGYTTTGTVRISTNAGA